MNEAIERALPCEACGKDVILVVAGAKDLVTPMWGDDRLAVLCWDCSLPEPPAVPLLPQEPK